MMLSFFVTPAMHSVLIVFYAHESGETLHLFQFKQVRVCFPLHASHEAVTGRRAGKTPNGSHCPRPH